MKVLVQNLGRFSLEQINLASGLVHEELLQFCAVHRPMRRLIDAELEANPLEGYGELRLESGITEVIRPIFSCHLGICVSLKDGEDLGGIKGGPEIILVYYLFRALPHVCSNS